jgi:pyruvate/2-oxoglutarate dehydrogenase complex dihydrolipoamide acyltransferase (E2) component
LSCPRHRPECWARSCKQTGETAHVGDTIAILEDAAASNGTSAAQSAQTQSSSTGAIAARAEGSTGHDAKEDDQGDQYAEQPFDSKANPAGRAGRRR